MNKKRANINISLILSILWNLLLTVLSLQTGTETTGLSLSLTEWLHRWLIPWCPVPTLHLTLRTMAHFFLFLINGSLLYHTFISLFPSKTNLPFYTFIACIPLSFLNELIKIGIPGRHCQWDEALLNLLGALVGILLAWFVYKRFIHHAKKHSDSL